MIEILKAKRTNYFSMFIDERGFWVNNLGHRDFVMLSEMEIINSKPFQAKLRIIEKLYGLEDGTIMKNMPEAINDLY